MTGKIFYRIEAGVPMPPHHRRRTGQEPWRDLADALSRMQPTESVVYEGHRAEVTHAARNAGVEVTARLEGNKRWRVWRVR
jgi:hypothetical protein